MTAARVAANDRHVTARARPLAAQILAWYRRTILSLLSQPGALRSAKARGTVDRRVRELAALLERATEPEMTRAILAEASAAGYTAGDLEAIAMTNPRRLIYLQEWRDGQLRRAQGVMDSTVEMVRARAAEIVRDSTRRDETDRTPNLAEVARRIRLEAQAEEPGRIIQLSASRAEVVARTEMGLTANTGRAQGMALAGVEGIEWLAYSDGRSGDRHHERMDGKIVALGEMFRLPSGARMRWPLDTDGPVGEIVNCRCTFAPARAPARRG